jgi:hypothetical protein
MHVPTKRAKTWGPTKQCLSPGYTKKVLQLVNTGINEKGKGRGPTKHAKHTKGFK